MHVASAGPSACAPRLRACTHTHTFDSLIVREHVVPFTHICEVLGLPVADVRFHATVAGKATWRFRSFQTCSGLHGDPACEFRTSRRHWGITCVCCRRTRVPCASVGSGGLEPASGPARPCRFSAWMVRASSAVPCSRPFLPADLSVCRVYSGASAPSSRVLMVSTAESIPLSCVMTVFVSRHCFRLKVPFLRCERSAPALFGFPVRCVGRPP